MGSFLNSPSQPLRDGQEWARRQLLPPEAQGCLPPHVGQDVHLDIADCGPVVPAHDGYSVRPHQELLKVPADVVDLHGFPEEAARCAQELRGGRTGVLQESVELLLFVPVHIPFLKELEIRDEAPTRPDILEGGQDLRVLSWFLFSKLVAREAQNDQTKWCKLFL